jgi:hypothetical protein
MAIEDRQTKPAPPQSRGPRAWPRPTVGRNDWGWIGRSYCGMRCGAISPSPLPTTMLPANAEHPLTHDETSLANIADWGPTEGWSDRTDARGER